MRGATVNVLVIARNQSLSFRVKERTAGEKMESFTIPPCEQAVILVFYVHMSVNRKFLKMKVLSQKL